MVHHSRLYIPAKEYGMKPDIHFLSITSFNKIKRMSFWKRGGYHIQYVGAI